MLDIKASEGKLDVDIEGSFTDVAREISGAVGEVFRQMLGFGCPERETRNLLMDMIDDEIYKELS